MGYTSLPYVLNSFTALMYYAIPNREIFVQFSVSMGATKLPNTWYRKNVSRKVKFECEKCRNPVLSYTSINGRHQPLFIS